MEYKQNSFSLYDFLGYLIPGALTIYLYKIVKDFKALDEIEFDKMFEIYSKDKLEEVFVFIIFSYSLGHILSFLSSITIEKYGNLKYGYPSKYLLGISSTVSSKPTFHRKMFLTNKWRYSRILLILPIVLLDELLGNFLDLKFTYTKKLDNFLIQSIKLKVFQLIEQLGLTSEDYYESFSIEKTDFHRIVSHYAFENCKHHQFRMVNYVSLYGFLRNLAFIFNSMFWIYLFNVLSGINFDYKVCFQKAAIIAVIALLAYISFMAYMKFYRRYTLESLMLLLIDESLVEQNKTL